MSADVKPQLGCPLLCIYTVNSVMVLHYLHICTMRNAHFVIWWLFVKYQQKKRDASKILQCLDLGKPVALIVNEKASSYHQQNPKCHLRKNNPFCPSPQHAQHRTSAPRLAVNQRWAISMSLLMKVNQTAERKVRSHEGKQKANASSPGQASPGSISERTLRPCDPSPWPPRGMNLGKIYIIVIFTLFLLK